MCWESIFWGKNGRFGPNVLTILAGSKVLVPAYQKTNKAPKHIVFLWSGMALNGPRTQFFGAKKAKIWPKMPILGQKLAVFGPKSWSFGEGAKFWYPQAGKPIRHLFCLGNMGLWDLPGPKMEIFAPKFWIFLDQKTLFFNCDFCHRAFYHNT